MFRRWEQVVVAIVVAFAIAPGASAATPEEGVEFFEKEIRPLLSKHCFECHGSQQKVKGGLRLSSRGSMLTGGESGPAAAPGKPSESLLVAAVHYRDLQMPPNGKLPETETAKLERWIEIGMPWPADSDAAASGARHDEPFKISDEQRRFWSFQPPRSVAPPVVSSAALNDIFGAAALVQHPAALADGPAGDIDRFVLAALDAKGLRPNALADKRTLIRRASFDLIGLPPTAEEIASFLADESPAAWQNLIERLLASPHYGERWGRHWLDVAHYADTAGETADYPSPEAYRYRDYVIAAFQHDKPYDEFVREQIAGDILARSAPRERYAELVTATGYLAISRRFGFDPENYMHLTFADTIDVVGKSVLGLSLGCARCHDHKYDPISSADYYALYGIFSSTRFPHTGSESRQRPYDMPSLIPEDEAARLRKEHQDKLAALDAERQKLEAEKSPDAIERKRQHDELSLQTPVEVAYAVAEGSPADAKIQIRGEANRPGESVPRRFLEILGGQRLPADSQGSGRAELAQWLTRPENPLTARVIVNRVWRQHFGKGLVATPSDFGLRGQPPTHPELLDYLATRFVAEGWSIKKLHRWIMLSRAYRISSAEPSASQTASESLNHSAALAADPDNKLLWRFERRRLDAESIRDALLAVGGDLDRSPGREHPFPPVNTWGFTQHAPFKAVYETRRRSVYLMTQRIQRHPFLSLFDGADPNMSVGERLQTTMPTQALFFMNDPLVHAEAQSLAARLIAAHPSDSDRVRLAHELAWGAVPTEQQQARAAAFLDDYRRRLSETGASPEQQTSGAWAAYARALFASNAFLFVD